MKVLMSGSRERERETEGARAVAQWANRDVSVSLIFPPTSYVPKTSNRVCGGGGGSTERPTELIRPFLPSCGRSAAKSNGTRYINQMSNMSRTIYWTNYFHINLTLNA